MTEPTRVGGVLPEVLAEVVDRAGHGYERWAELVAQTGYCHHPIRLAGRIDQADRTTGEVHTVYDSEREPDGVLLKACGTRREPRCPSCAPPTGPTPTSSSPPASRAARASLSPWQGTPAVGDLHRPELRSGPHQQGPGAPRPAASPLPTGRPLLPRQPGWQLAPPQ
jgi:hypothetical protein